MADGQVALLGLEAALPRRRMTRQVWAQAWGGRGGAGSRPVAGPDEDALTLSCDALTPLVDYGGGADTLVAVSTTPPHAERSSAAVLAVALRLDDRILVEDAGGSQRAATGAALTALRAAAGGRTTLLAAADLRDAEPGSDLEPLLGDAGAAVRIGPTGGAQPLAVLLGEGCVAGDLPETWRPPGERFLRRADPAFAPRHTAAPVLEEAIRRALHASEVDAGTVAVAALSSVDVRTLRSVAGAVGLPAAASAAVEESSAHLGHAGVAAPWLALHVALEVARPGDVVVQAAHGGGSADALVWRVGAGVEAWRSGRRRLVEVAAAAEEVPSYARFLRLRGLLPSERPEPYSSMPLLAREREQDLALTAGACPECGRVVFPQRRLCDACGHRGLDARPLGRGGHVVTWTEDHIVPNPEPPTVMAVADIDGGGRFYGRLVAPAGRVVAGMRVRLVLRRLHEAGGLAHYFWAMRPVPGEAEEPAVAAPAGATA